MELLGYGNVPFTRDATKLTINLPTQPAGSAYAFGFKITGTNIVPEPSSAAMLGLGAAYLLARRGRCRARR